MNEAELLPVATRAQAWRSLRRSLRHHRALLALTLLAVVGGAVAGVVGPALVGRIVDVVVDGRDASAVTGPAIGLLVVAVLQGGMTATGLALVARTGELVLADLRERVVARALDLPLDQVERAGTGDVLARVGGDVAVVSEGVRTAVPALVEAGMTVALTIVGLAVLDPRFAVAGLCGAPVQLLTLRWYLRRSSPIYTAEREAAARRAAQVLGSIEGAATVRAYRLGPEHVDLVRERSEVVFDLNMQATVIRERFYGRLNLAEVIGLGAVLAVGFWLVRDGAASVGQATAAALLFHRLFDPINTLLGLFDEGQAAAAGLARLVGVADIPSPPEVAGGVPADGSVVIEGVGFAYVPGHEVVSEVSLSIAPGERVAVVGASGAGKTTLAKLVAGIHPVTAGRIAIGGVAVDDLGPELRHAVALVTQEVHVFAGPLADDLRLARPAATEADLRAALDLVGALGWAEALPQGLATVVGEGGERLSATQAQQVALARLVLADPLVAVLDEATAEAGSAGARLLEGAADRALAGRTAVVVAHRLSQAAAADRVVVMDAGRVVEVGTHAELVARAGRYAELWSAWSAVGR
jgi:ATP-binding cassette subfamily C protein